MSDTHLFTYYTWKSRRSWRLDSVREATESGPAMRYIFRDVGAWREYAKKDTVLWVVGLSGDGHPTLEACLHISGNYFRTNDDGQTMRGVRGAMPPSRYFGLNDAQDAMTRIAFSNSRGHAWRLGPTRPGPSWRSQHGKRLQNPLRIAPEGQAVRGETEPSEGARPLRELAKSVLRRAVFISYKHADFRDQGSRAFLDQVSLELARKGLSVWLDRVMLVGTGGQETGETRRELGKLLAEGLEQSRVVLGMWRDLYGTPNDEGENWTRHEWRTARSRIALDPQRRYRSRRGLDKPTERVLLPAQPRPSDAAAIAALVARKCRRLLA